MSFNTNVWYDCVPVGAHKLNKYLESMCKEAGIYFREKDEPQLAGY